MLFRPWGWGRGLAWQAVTARIVGSLVFVISVAISITVFPFKGIFRKGVHSVRNTIPVFIVGSIIFLLGHIHT
jgi:hypothetical protein